MSTNMRRTVVTGIGVMAPNGKSPDEFWRNANLGRSFIEADAEMEAIGIKSRALCRIHDFDVREHMDDELARDVASEDRFVQIGVAAGARALADAGVLGKYAASRVGAIFSSAIGGTPTVQKIWEEATHGGAGELRYLDCGPRFYNAGMFNYPASLLARHFGLRGPCTSLSTGCTAGLDALGLAQQLVQTGEADVVLAGASEAPLATLTYATLDVIGSLSVAEGPAERASRPFDAKRGGFVIGEGAAVLVLEAAEAALARGARIYGEVVAYASDANAFHMTDLPADGKPMARVIEAVLRVGGVAPEQIDYINAHGSSTPQNDVFETNAYKSVFGPRAYRIPISSTKSMIGHSLSSASLMGCVAALGTFSTGMVHPTANYEVPDPLCDLDYVTRGAREVRVGTALVTASGFGGIHSAAILRRLEGKR